MIKLAFVEDESLIRESMADILTDQGFEVVTFADSESAHNYFAIQLPDVVLLDIGLGDDYEAGFKLCKDLRQRPQVLPIIFLTSKNADYDKISGFRLGADDYITKDINTDLLIVRIKALLERAKAFSSLEDEKQKDLVIGDLRICVSAMNATWKDQKLNLSVTQLSMLKAIIRRPGNILNHEQLMHAANISVEQNTIAAHIKIIRQQFLSVDPEFACIKTERGLGYRWL